jgi:hypothetical protein
VLGPERRKNIFPGIDRNGLVVANKEMAVEVNAQTTKCLVMSRDQHEGQNRNINVYNKSFERGEQFRYFGPTLTNQNSISGEIKNSLKSGNACCYSVQNLLSSRLLFKNVKIKINRTDFACCFVCL